jgi:hypothetical protein
VDGNPPDPSQSSLFENWVELGEKFFKAITAYPVPADMRALRALKNSALALDLYVWATYRVYLANQKGCAQFIPWDSFMKQLGCNYNSVKDFKRKALAAFKKVRDVYPTLKIGKARGGFFINPGPTAVPQAPSTTVVDSGSLNLLWVILRRARWRSEYLVGSMSYCGRMTASQDCLRAQRHVSEVLPIFKVC